ncbi:hypothetical protein Dde_3399 [Oleidesulfovibrio alaskensis G20]|jgi:hypothetical protein|uniref:Uncharacterized protein n=1 Tax=Oleidesulfovibrio alaskensis (strain ATCC BAA-1058 / DSM 17464 / G20) TaxID=207559 RepID=Q30VV3_OLEA2|nr:hypothetical protein [Oleidesulfovibrio alaskensis]ABB40193.1 hypothetical protein Dde_3399 [Oleidesulfovibrio alaskensis G20]
MQKDDLQDTGVSELTDHKSNETKSYLRKAKKEACHTLGPQALNDEDVQKIEQQLFFDYHYAARCFLSDIAKSNAFKRRYDKYSMTLKMMLVEHGIDMEVASAVLRELIIEYNNIKNKKSKYQFQLLPMEKNHIFNMADLHKEERKALDFFLFVSHKYGYTFTTKHISASLTSEVEDVLQCKKEISSCIKKIQNIQFIRYARKKDTEITFNYKEKNGNSFFEKHREGYYYLYITPNAYSDSSATKIAITSTLNMLKKKKQLDTKNPFLFSDQALIQVVIPCKSLEKPNTTKSFIERNVQTIHHQVVAYNAWHYTTYPETAPRGIQNTIPLSKVHTAIYTSKYEQLDSQVRLIGLWLWDRIYFDGQTQAQAFRSLTGIKTNHCRTASDNKTLSRDYHLTDACIRKCKILNYRDV